MRTVLVAVFVALGCSKNPSPATPANQAAPDYQKAAADELAFLAADADFVFGLDMAALRKSQLWRAFEPQVTALMRNAEQLLGTSCADDFIQKLDRITMAVRMKTEDDIHGSVVMRGADMPVILECSAKTASASGKTTKLDRGVLVTTNQDKQQTATRAIGSSTLVTHFAKTASRESLDALLATGVPLRSSSAFLQLYERREPNAAMWGMANGNSPAFAQLASSGMRPRSIDGTIVVTDKMALNLRMTMSAPAEATKLAGEVDKVKPMAASYVEKIETRVDGAVVHVGVTMTEAQLRAVTGMVGGMMGAP